MLSPHSSPSSLVLKSPKHQLIHTTAPHIFCLSLSHPFSFLLALPLGCLSCSSQQDLYLQSTSRTLGQSCPSAWHFPRCCSLELQLISSAGKCKLPGPRISLASHPLAEIFGLSLPAQGSRQSCPCFLLSLPGEMFFAFFLGL